MENNKNIVRIDIEGVFEPKEGITTIKGEFLNIKLLPELLEWAVKNRIGGTLDFNADIISPIDSYKKIAEDFVNTKR
jgi:hypothetical protein